MAIDRSAKFITVPGEIESTGLSIPKSLKPIVTNAPQEDKAIEDYLSELVKVGKITADELTFLIDSGALQN